MDTNTIGRLYQAGRNTVKKQDFGPVTGGLVGPTVSTLPVPPKPAMRSGPKRRIENFLIELLCALIWSDWRPIGRALKSAGVVDGRDIDFIEPAAQQQVGVPGHRGIVDLVLGLELAGQPPEEIWIEVKAGAALHGNQLANYRRAICDAADADERQRKLIIVDHESASAVEGVPQLTWQQIHDTILPSDGRLWRDFAAFLVSQELARSSGADLSSVVTDEVIAEILAGVLQERPDWQKWLVWTKGPGEYMRLKTLRRALAKQSGQHGSRAIRLFADGQHTSLALGLFDREGPAFGVQLTATRWYPVDQSTIRRAAEHSGLDRSVWDFPPRKHDDVVVAAYWSAQGDVDKAEVIAWMVDRIHELEGRGLLADLDANGRVIPLPPSRVMSDQTDDSPS